MTKLKLYNINITIPGPHKKIIVARAQDPDVNQTLLNSHNVENPKLGEREYKKEEKKKKRWNSGARESLGYERDEECGSRAPSLSLQIRVKIMKEDRGK